ncbi:MAG TPA: hypothetical protein VLG67_02125, partial [Candidatus Saccharimonadales bacterium]|nr:hypothetical protein [Candidatus Saccharimonadales bacterium]
MLNIIGKKNLYFIISLLVIIPGTISLLLWGLRLSIDFTGGTRTTLLFPKTVNQQTVEKVKTIFKQENAEIVSIRSADRRLIVQTKPINEQQNSSILNDLKKDLGTVKQEDFETIGATIGAETTLNAFKTVGIASVMIVLYIAY